MVIKPLMGGEKVRLIKNKKGKSGINISWFGKSVSGLVVIAGIIALILSATTDEDYTNIGVLFVVLGLIGAIFMTFIMKLKF